VGGNSLLALRLVARLTEEFGGQVKVAALYDYPTPAALADWLSRRHGEIGS
jgi:hypothetical protein